MSIVFDSWGLENKKISNQRKREWEREEEEEEEALRQKKKEIRLEMKRKLKKEKERDTCCNEQHTKWSFRLSGRESARGCIHAYNSLIYAIL